MVRLWRTADYTLVREQRIDTGRATLRLTFSPDGLVFATSGRDLPVQLWRTADGTPMGSFPAEGLAVAFSPDGRRLALAQPGGQIGLVDRERGTTVQTLAAHRYLVTDITFSSDGQTLISASSGDEELKVWRLADGALLHAAPTSIRASIVMSPGGELLAAGGMARVRSELRGTIQLIDVATGSAIRSWEVHGWLVNAVAFSPDGKTLVSGSSWEALRLWHIK